MPSTPSLDAHALQLMQAGRLHEALPIAQRAVANARCRLPGHGMLATLLLQMGRVRDAEEVVSAAVALDFGSAEACDGLAYVSMLLDRHDLANSLYQQATELSPKVAAHWYNLACSERSLGRLVEAERACDRCIAIEPQSYVTYLVRSGLRVQTADFNHIDDLQSRLADAGPDAGATAYLGYALAKELDDVERFDDAFRWFVSAAQARRSQIRYDIAADEQVLRRIKAAFPRIEPARVCDGAGSNCIFIVGLPRSGTTLVDRVLGGLPGVRSNGETDNISRAVSAGARRVGDMFDRAAGADAALVAAKYARLARTSQDGWVIDKLPTNYLYLGVIQRALPQASILLVRRSPLDSCFAMYRTLFGKAYPFSYDFDELARYYAAYDALIGHWRAVLGDSLQEIVYEDLVREPLPQFRRIAGNCGLVWTDAAVDIQNNRSASLTASASQVRRPIYGTSSGRWRNYRRQLAPLIRALRRTGVRIPDDA
jgi:tetratricopeptide (TPR) repeat protein